MEAVGGNASTVRLPVVGERTVVPHGQNMYLTRGGLLMEVGRLVINLNVHERLQSGPLLVETYHPCHCP